MGSGSAKHIVDDMLDRLRHAVQGAEGDATVLSTIETQLDRLA
jgi:hypothetical protein